MPAAAGVVVAVGWRAACPAECEAPRGKGGGDGRTGASFRELLASRPVRLLILARILTDPLWFFIQNWQVTFLQERIGLSLAGVGRLAWIPPLGSILAVFLFGILSDRLAAAGMPASRARLVPMIASAAMACSVAVLPLAGSAPAAIALLALAGAMCAVWLSLSAILVGTTVPPAGQVSALGLMSALGCISAVGFNACAGTIIDRFGYPCLFWAGAALHPLAAAILAWTLLRRSSAHGAATRAVPPGEAGIG